MKAFSLVAALLLIAPGPLRAAGKQLTGVYAPTPTPALAPEAARQKFVVPEGFEVRLFAAEPEVVNPVAMTWDERGRLWVLELYEYPLGAPAGQKGRDRIKILEDTDNDGRADKVTIFADGLNLATGLQLGYGGVFVGQAPDLLFLTDTNHDDHADTREVLLTGFGLEDRHELLNGFTWGPDGWLYLTHGVFTHSKVKIPEASAPGVEVTAALARFHPRTKKFEVFAEGTSNPWGVDFDAAGNAFVSACVIDHLFHLAPGGTYQRQAGSPANPYAYEILPSIVQHKHHMAAYCGICIYQGDQFPAAYQGHVFMGNIHQNALNHDRLIPQGASFKAEPEKDFVTTSDGWFRPISEQVGPDGALWIGDWCDKYPCYQNAQADPEGVDRERGRIWRVVYVGPEAGKKIPPRPDPKMDLNKLATTNLVALLAHPNEWQRRMAQRILMERLSSARQGAGGAAQDEPGVATALANAMEGNQPTATRVAAFWGLNEFGDRLDRHAYWAPDLPSATNWLRSCMLAWRIAARMNAAPDDIADLELLAGSSDPRVQFAVATAVRRIVSSNLVTDGDINDTAPVGKVLAALTHSAAGVRDPLVNYMIWLAGEPLFAFRAANGLRWLAEFGPQVKPLSETLTYKSMRRLCDLGDAARLDLAVQFLGEMAGKDQDLTLAALNGLVEGQRGKPLAPAAATQSLFAKLRENSDERVRTRAGQLGVYWQDAPAIQAALARVNDSKLPAADRIRVIQALQDVKTDAAREALLTLLSRENPTELITEGVQTLGKIGGDTVAASILKAWPQLTTAARTVAAEELVSRHNWAVALLEAVAAKQIQAGDLPLTAVRQLAAAKDESIRTRTLQLIGRVRPANADKQKLIAEKKRMILDGPVDLQAGHELARKTCFVCHKLNGEGAEVGPDLTGSGRSSLDALLANVIDPNQVIGKGYENVVVELKDERTVSGRLVENTDARVRLLSAGPKEEIVARSDIVSLKVSELSVMPEGLEQMPDADFRNLIHFILTAPNGVNK